MQQPEAQNTPEQREKFALETLQQFIRSGDLAGAKDFCQWLLSYCPDHPQVNFYLGNIEQQLGNLEGAKQAFIHASKCDKNDNPRTLFNIGYVSFRLNDFEFAIISYRMALRAQEKENASYMAYNSKVTTSGSGGQTIELGPDRLQKNRVLHNLGIAHACFAIELSSSNPQRAIEQYRAAIDCFQKTMRLIDADANEGFEYDHVYGYAFTNMLMAQKALAKLDQANSDSWARIFSEHVEQGLCSAKLVNFKRDIQHLAWEWQQSNNIPIGVEKILTDEIAIKLGAARSLEQRLQKMVRWHADPIDWHSLYQKRREAMETIVALQQFPVSNEADLQHIGQQLNAGFEGSDQKKRRVDSGAAPHDVSCIEEHSDLVDAQLHKPKNKVDQLNNDLSEDMLNIAPHPDAFHIMLSSPAFLRLHGWYRFEQDRLPHVIQKSYTYFDEQALTYIIKLLTCCHYQAQIAGFFVAKNQLVGALQKLDDNSQIVQRIYDGQQLRFIGSIQHQGEPSIQTRRRQDLVQVAHFHLDQYLFKHELLRGLVLVMQKNMDEAQAAFDKCYQYIERIEGVLKRPQSTETLRLLKDDHQALKISKLNKIVRQHETKIPKELKARIERLETLFQQDTLRIRINNFSIPFPYDMFAADFSQRKNNCAPGCANISDHVLSLCYLTPDGMPHVSSIKFNINGVVYDLFNAARKNHAHSDRAKNNVVERVNAGHQFFHSLSEREQQLPQLSFAKHAQAQVTFNDKILKHSEQVFYYTLHTLSDAEFVQLMTQFEAKSSDKLTTGCTIVGLVSNMQSTKTGCVYCKTSALAMQNPRPDDESAFLNRFHRALVGRGYKMDAMVPNEPKLFMATRILAFTQDGDVKRHGRHRNPPERDLTQSRNLAIFEDLDCTSFASGYRKGIL